MADLGQNRPEGMGTLGDVPGNRSTGDFGVSSSGEMAHFEGLGQKVPSSLSMSMGMNSKVPDGGIGAPMRNIGSHLSLHEAENLGSFQQGGRISSYGNLDGASQFPGVSQLPATTQSSGDALADALSSLDVNNPDSRYGASGLRRNPRSSMNLASHKTGLHIDDDVSPNIQPRTLIIHGITPELSESELRADLESFGDVQSLYTGLIHQGQIMVTFYDCVKAVQAFSFLEGRQLNGRRLSVELQKSQKDASAGHVVIFNVPDTISDDDVAKQMGMFGPVAFVGSQSAVAGCRDVYFNDIRHAQKAQAALYPQRPSTINEDGDSSIPHMNMQSGMYSNPQHQQDQFAARSWVDQNMRQDLSRLVGQGQLNSNPDLVALLSSAPREALDELVRTGYLPQHGSSNSLASNKYGSTTSLTGAGTNYGSSANLPGAGNHSSNANLLGETDFGSSANLKGSSNNLAGLSGMSSSASHNNLASGLMPGGDRLSQGLTPQQMAALQIQNGLMGSSGPLNKNKRSMTTNDLYSLTQGGNQLGGIGGQFSSGQYDPSELSGWGGASQATDLDTANLLAQAQALDSLNGLGNLGLQRSVSALQLQQLNQQAQQQQLLMQLTSAYNNPQALNQLNNMRMPSTMPLGFNRGKMHRPEDNLGGGRLSRRAADPTVEAERRAQQDRHYALDVQKVERGEDMRTTLMIKNIPNKYTQKMLLQTIDEQFIRQYDFFYLPIDFKNKCNVGYAFINMVQPKYIIPLMERFNHKKWERFNSEKVCSISYARIQGKQQLVTHFQNSSLLHEDKRCRPILFKTDGELAAEQEPFPTAASGARPSRNRPANTDSSQEGSQSSNSLNAFKRDQGTR